MNKQVESRHKLTENLSFDKADVGKQHDPTRCASCKRAITDTYFAINGLVSCPACHKQLMSQSTGGSGAGRFGRALLFGGAAAVVGALLWFAVASITGMEIGYIGIAVGFLVGFGVKKGSEARGGFAYQALAIVLTYLAIVSSYMPDIAKGLDEASNNQQHATSTATHAGHPAKAPNSAAEQRDFVDQMVFGAMVFAIALAAPFLAGFENVIGILIIGFALFQAWKINKRVELQVSGPLRVKAPSGGVRAA